MIDEKKLAELRTLWDATGDPLFRDIADTMEALWKVSRAAELHIDLCGDLADGSAVNHESLERLAEALAALKANSCE